MKNIEFEGIKNIRDFENIENSNGFYIKPKRILRSGGLSSMTNHDVKALIDEYQLRTVIDLRTNEEKKQSPDVVMDGVTYIHIPIFEEKTIGITRESNNKFDLNHIPEMSKLYGHMVKDEYSILQIRKVIEIIINSNHQPVLFHCTAGKDRTGIIAMLILSMLDVPFSAIFEDYLYTNNTVQMEAQAYYDMVYEKTASELLAEKIRNILLAKEEYLQSAIDSINSGFGGIQGFIRDKLHITNEQMEAFKNEMLVKDYHKTS